jgi:type 1 fimbriae regulatory protein FimE
VLAYRHGLRAAELCSLRWAQVDLRHGRLHVNRGKGGIESVHPLHGPELRALRPLQGPYVFTTEAGTPVTTARFLRMVQRTGRAVSWASEFAVYRKIHRASTGSVCEVLAGLKRRRRYHGGGDGCGGRKCSPPVILGIETDGVF